MPLPTPDSQPFDIDELMSMIDGVLAGQPSDVTEDLDEEEIRRLLSETVGKNSDLIDLSKSVPTVLGNTRGPWDEMPPSESH